MDCPRADAEVGAIITKTYVVSFDQGILANVSRIEGVGCLLPTDSLT